MNEEDKLRIAMKLEEMMKYIHELQEMMPSDEENIIDLIVEHNVIDKKSGEKIKDMKGFRNILVHRYGHADDEIVYRILSTGLNDFYVFEEQVDRYLKTVVTK